MEHTADLAIELLKAAKKRGESLRSIATAANVPYSWLVRWFRGDFEDPGSRRVEDVYRYLHAKSVMDQSRQKKAPVEARP